MTMTEILVCRLHVIGSNVLLDTNMGADVLQVDPRSPLSRYLGNMWTFSPSSAVQVTSTISPFNQALMRFPDLLDELSARAMEEIDGSPYLRDGRRSLFS